MARLTAAAVAKLRASPKGRREIPDDSCPGLHLLIQQSGVKSWALRYRRPSGKSCKLTLGRVDLTGADNAEPVIGGPLSLAAARRLASQCRHELALGRDPGAEHTKEAKKIRKVQAKAALLATASADDASYPAMARRYIERHAKPNIRGWQATARTLGLDPRDDTLPIMPDGIAERWSARAAASIARTDVVAEIDRAVENGRGPTAGNHTLAALRAMFRWHVRRGSLDNTPCALIDAPVPMRKLRRSHRLSDDEIRWMWKALDDMPKAYACFLRFTLLTAVRRDEARKMVRSELSPDGEGWTVPAVRMKKGLDHFIPLSEQAREQLAAVPHVEGKAGLIFSLNGKTAIGGMSKWKRSLGEKMLELAHEEHGEDATIGAWQIHDFRRNARSYLSKVTSPDIAERVLSHVVGGVRAHYDVHQYADEKRRALESWASEVERIVAGEGAK